MPVRPFDELLDLHLGYPESEGDPLLRERIGTLCEVDPGRVLVTNAPEEGIFLVMAALVRTGDRVLVQSPCYQSLFELGRYHGGDVECWPLQEKETAWSPLPACATAPRRSSALRRERRTTS